MFGSCKSSTRFDRNSSSGSNIYSFFPYVFLGSKNIISFSNTKRKDFGDFESHYVIKEKIGSFWNHVNISSFGDEE